MNGAKKNIFLTGAPSSGKTTVIKRVIAALPFPANGFYTEEEKIHGKRAGFVLNTLDGKRGYLAYENIRSDFRVRRYGVSIENIDAVAVPSIVPSGDNIIILDEIGKMECFSPVFRRAVVAALDSRNIVVGTITFGGDDFILGVKGRTDIEIHEVTQENRDSLPALILRKVAALMTTQRP